MARSSVGAGHDDHSVPPFRLFARAALGDAPEALGKHPNKAIRRLHPRAKGWLDQTASGAHVAQGFPWVRRTTADHANVSCWYGGWQVAQ
jgi:hypothetical protein